METETKESHLRVLNVLEEAGTPLRSLQIAAALNLSYATVTTYLGIMECQGLVERIKTSRNRILWKTGPQQLNNEETLQNNGDKDGGKNRN